MWSPFLGTLRFLLTVLRLVFVLLCTADVAFTNGALKQFSSITGRIIHYTTDITLLSQGLIKFC